MKQKITFKLCLAMLGLLLSFSTGAQEVIIGKLKYTFYDNNTASVAAADKSTISGEIVIPASVENYNKTYSVTTIGKNAFSYCSGLTAITIPNSVTTIGSGAFDNCSGLTAITIPNSVTTIGSGAFYYCSGLTAIIIPNSVKTIGNQAFFHCSGLKEFIVAKDNPNYSSLDGILYNKQQTEIVQAPLTIKSVTIPNSVTTIDNYAFYGCTKLTVITIPNSVKTIDNHVFCYCSGLTAITIPNSVKTIGNSAFCYCSGLTTITIGNSVTTIGENAFNNCSELTTITIGNSVTTIGNYAFCYCSGLTAITIPNSVTTIGSGAFDNCSGLTAITIPNSVTTIGGEAFRDCSGLKEFIVAINNPNYSSTNGILYNKQQTEIIQAPHAIRSVNIPNSVTTIGNYAFYKCSGLTAITIPNSVTTIGMAAFSSCYGLTAITIPNSVTTIGNNAFWNCSGLTAITIPNSVTTIGNYAFFRCTGLREIKVYIEEPITIIDNVFRNVDYSTCKLYVPQGSIDKYKAANIWKLFTNISALADDSAIEGIDEDKLNVYSVDGKVVIKNLREGEAISICNTTGQNVYQGNETEVPLNKGIYFVKVGTIVSKVMVQ